MIPHESALFSRACKPTSLGIVSYQVTAKVSAPQTSWCVPWFVTPQGISGGIAGSKAIDFYAISRGVPRKPACNLVETAQRKSHPLEGSCQEAIPLPYPTFDSFFRLRWRSAHSPGLWPQTHPCFSCCGVGYLCAAPVTHQAQGLWTSRFCARHLPLARVVPQKTLGSLPCPIVYNVQITWLPRGSNFYRAHGRGVARLPNPAVGHL